MYGNVVDIDLDAICARLARNRMVNVGSPILYLNGHDAQDLEDIAALVTEVERQRLQIQTKNAQLEEVVSRVHHMR